MSDFVEVPILRVELNHVKQALLKAVEVRHGELCQAIEKGIDLAYHQIPVLVSDRVRGAVEEAVWDATGKALKEYYGPGGNGYAAILNAVKDRLETKLTDTARNDASDDSDGELSVKP